MDETEKEKIYNIATTYQNEGREFLLISPQKIKELLEEIGHLKSSINFIEQSLLMVKRTNDKVSDNS